MSDLANHFCGNMGDDLKADTIAGERLSPMSPPSPGLPDNRAPSM